ncbi:hypothetical protein [Novosphingobium marinum]|uniref:hypothetical protein n=1 Tax=Novosphingobium marinum TaxID=1514948 RepID=UPI001663B984|nr:hypothetical protein [Novosphingobium marinum]
MQVQPVGIKPVRAKDCGDRSLALTRTLLPADHGIARTIQLDFIFTNEDRGPDERSG